MRFHQGLKSEHHPKAEKEKHLNHQTTQIHNFGFQALVFRGSIFRGFAMNLPNLRGGLTLNITLKGALKKWFHPPVVQFMLGEHEHIYIYNNLEPDSHPLIKWNRLSIGWWWWWCPNLYMGNVCVFNQTSIHLKNWWVQGELWEIHLRNSVVCFPGQVKNRMGRMPWIFGEP